METITLIAPDVPTEPCEVNRRTAVRAFALRGNAVLVLEHANPWGVKFPGGGVDPDEAHADALRRELREECGAEVIDVRGPVLEIVERRPAPDNPDVAREHRSLYFTVTISDLLTEQQLIDYEIDMELTPRWLPLDETRQRMEIAAAQPDCALWAARELAAINALCAHLNGERSATPPQV